MADWLDIGSLLNSYRNNLTNRATGLSPGPNSSIDPARQLLLRSNINWENPPDTMTSKSNRGGPSVVSRLFDILSRPRFAVAEATRQGIQPGGNDLTDALGGAWQGFSGKKKTSWRDVISEQEFNMHPEQFQKPTNPEDYKRLDFNYKGPNPISNRALIGFGVAGDLALDPLNLIGSGTVKGGLNAARKGLGIVDKVKPLEGLRPGATISSATHIRPPDPVPPESLIPQNQILPPGLRNPDTPIPTNIPQPTNVSNALPPTSIPTPTSTSAFLNAPEAPEFSGLSQAEKIDIGKKLIEEYKKSGADTFFLTHAGPQLQNLITPGSQPNYGNTLAHLASFLDNPGTAGKGIKFDAAAEIEKLTGIKVDPKNISTNRYTVRQSIPLNNAANNAPQPTPSPIPNPVPIENSASGIADEAIISPASRTLNDSAGFPKVQIPRSATAVGQTVPEIRNLIREISDTAGVARPKHISKMNRMELTYTLKQLRNSAGKTAVSKATQIEKLPTPPPKLNVAGAVNTGTKAKESSEALRLAQKYEDDVLTQPNKFPTPGRNPAVNNPAQQVNFFNNKIRPAARALYPGRNKAGVNAVALRMLREAENAFEAKGLHPAFWSGVPFKLSEVIDRMGGLKNLGDEHLTRIMTALGNQDASKITNTKLRNAVEAMITEQKLKEVPYIDMALNKSVATASVAQQALSEPKFEAFKNAIMKSQKTDLKTPKQMVNLSPNVPLYITPKSADFANQTLKQIFKASTPLPQQAINSNLKTIQQYIRSDGSTFWAPVNNAISKAINQTIGGPNPKQLGTVIGPAANAENWLLSRISTAYGNKDLRPTVMIVQQTARARATRRAKVLNSIAKTHNAAEITEAFKVAQGGIGGSTQKVDNLADDLSKTFENLFDATDLTKATGNSVAFRTGMVMSEINKQLKYMKAGFKFTNSAKATDSLGNVHDFSQGADWLKSWQIADVDDPLVFTSKVQAAVENVVGKNAFLDDFASRWGSKFYDARNGFTARISDPRLKNLYYNPELANQMGTVLKNWDQIYDPKSPVVKLFDQATSLWKTGMTIYMPAHHIRNFIGDVYLGWMDGVNTIKPYRVASKVMWSQRNRYDDLQSVEMLVNKRAISAALTRPGDNVLRTKSGLDVTAEQLYTAAFNKGLLQSANVVEDIMVDVIPKVKPLGGHLSSKIRGFAEGRDHFTRIAHFADIVAKSKSKNLEQVFEEAAKRVRKWHPDGMDLTGFERKYLRRVMPFYSWTRKSIPLIIEGAVLNPGKTMAYPKIMYGLQQFSGVESESITDPFPEDQLFPDWIKEKGIGPVAQYGMGGIPGTLARLSRSRPGFTGDPEGYTVANPSNPFIDTVAQFGGMGRFKDFRSGVGQMVNPFFRVPAEIGTGQTVLGTPVDYDPNKYATENIPLVAYLSQLGNIGLAGPTERGQQEGIPNTEGIVNWVTALGLRGTGASIKQAEFEARERAKKANGG